jgi:hypothetical protein
MMGCCWIETGYVSDLDHDIAFSEDLGRAPASHGGSSFWKLNMPCQGILILGQVQISYCWLCNAYSFSPILLHSIKLTILVVSYCWLYPRYITGISPVWL